MPAFLRQVPRDVDADRLRGMRPIRFAADGTNFLGGYRGLEEEGGAARRG